VTDTSRGARHRAALFPGTRTREPGLAYRRDVIDPFVRPYRGSDRDDVRDVCFRTGFMGVPVDWQFSDRDAFAHLFCTWYLDHRPDCAWVVDDGAGRAVGYLIGSPDGGDADGPAHMREFLVHHGLRRGLLVRPGTARFLWRAGLDAARDRRALAPQVDTARYPADLHINLLGPARGRGLGAELIRTWCERLIELDVPGLHLGTFGENTGAIAFFSTQGFRPAGDTVPNPGFRDRGGGRCTVRSFVRDLP
jgi:GNAT superfamily N-acetyltransferase